MANKDFIPRSQFLFYNWQEVFMVNLSDIGAERLMPPPVYHNLTSLWGNYKSKYAIAENPTTRTKGTIADRNVARAAYEKELRRVIKVYIINNPDVTDKQLADMGLPIYKTTRTPSKVETRSPYMKVILTEPRVLTIEFYESEDKKAKPAGQRGVKFVYILSDERPTDISQLINSESDTRTPVNLSFTEEERGKTLWFASRWENTRVKYGPWSEIFSAIIP